MINLCKSSIALSAMFLMLLTSAAVGEHGQRFPDNYLDHRRCSAWVLNHDYAVRALFNV